MTPQGTNLVLTSHVPHVEFHILLVGREDVGRGGGREGRGIEEGTSEDGRKEGCSRDDRVKEKQMGGRGVKAEIEGGDKK